MKKNTNIIKVSKPPKTIIEVKEFLVSIKSIGPVTANRIIFNSRHTKFDITQHDIGLLGKIKGVGPKKINAIREAVRNLSINDAEDILIFNG